MREGTPNRPDFLITVTATRPGPDGTRVAQLHVRRGTVATFKNREDLSEQDWREIMESLVWAFADSMGKEMRDWALRRSWSPALTKSGLHKGAPPKTHCSQNHELTPDNILTEPARNGLTRRRCRTCRAARMRKVYVRSLLLKFHGPCPNCGETHNADEVRSECVDAIAEAMGVHQPEEDQ